MNTKVASVLFAWMNLDQAEKEEFRKVAAGYTSQSENRQIEIKDRLEQQLPSLDFGPVKDPCPYCGR